jgi:hypothetical protein
MSGLNYTHKLRVIAIRQATRLTGSAVVGIWGQVRSWEGIMKCWIHINTPRVNEKGDGKRQ